MNQAVVPVCVDENDVSRFTTLVQDMWEVLVVNHEVNCLINSPSCKNMKFIENMSKSIAVVLLCGTEVKL